MMIALWIILIVVLAALIAGLAKLIVVMLSPEDLDYR